VKGFRIQDSGPSGAFPFDRRALERVGLSHARFGEIAARERVRLNPESSILNPSSGFTLIELVIVMATIGLLLTLAVPRYFQTIENGKINVQRQNIATIRDAIDKFYGDQTRYPETLDELVRLKYLRAIPVDPLTQSRDWVPVPPQDPTLGGVYDVRSAWKPKEDERAS
jgi:general secretion pathway protein G